MYFHTRSALLAKIRQWPMVCLVMDILKALGIKIEPGKAESRLGTLCSHIRSILEGFSEDEVRLITGYAGLLGSVAYADMDISEVEIRRIRAILAEKMHLGKNHIDPIVEILARHRVQLFAVEEHHYHRLINSVCTTEEKLDLLGALFSVAAANESISNEEEVVLRRISQGLLLSHKEFIAVRLEFRKYLDILK